MKTIIKDNREPDEKTKDHRRKTINPAIIGAGLLTIAAVGGILINVVSGHRIREAAATPEVSIVEVTPTPTPRPTPTPTPTVNSIRLYAYGRQLDADGFTTYIGDKPITLSIELDPKPSQTKVSWSMSDPESASLTVGDDGMSCEFSALKPSGKNELTIRCYGAEAVFPVYLWER